ncbi:hypothetical protein H0H92_010988 [Tricholoma furcatifolium]|nr:hypothetical protein H0H92_010988 [Tricholoma furcatifolium]
MYTLPISSTTSFSDDEEYDEYNDKPTLYATQTRFVPASGPAQWSLSRPSNNRSSQSSPMSQLPAEILIHILKHLHSTRDVLNAVRVSRKWCECSVELLWHKPVFPKYETLKKMSRRLIAPYQTFAYASFIRRLNLSTLSGHIKDDIFTTFASCDRLERLTLINCENLTDYTLSRVLPCYPNLVAVDLTGVVSTTNEAVCGLARAAKRLQGINLTGCSKVSDKGILAFAENCPMLRRVKLSGLTSLTDASICALAKSCPLLLELDLNHCSLITDMSLREIWMNSTHMREMRVSHCSQLTDAAFPASPLLEGLLFPDLRHPFPSKAPDTSAELPPLVLSHPLEHLRMLDLTMCCLVTDDAIDGITHYAPKIRNLVLSKCPLLTDRSVQNICKLGRHLHYLHLGHASKITDSSVRTLARSCTRLRYVDFAIFELAALPKLRRIGLVRVTNLTDEAIYALGERHTSLERIHLSYCDQISVLAVHFLLQKLDKLTHLSLTGVPAFRQPELQRYCRDPPKEFNSTQQSTFCVYSGKGIYQLRSFLSALFDQITDANGTDDTEYEDDDEDDPYIPEDTPEPEGVDNDEEETVSPRMLSESAYAASTREYQQPQNPPPSHEFVFRRDRPYRSATIPATHPTYSHPSASANIIGATSSLNAQILAASASHGSRRSPLRPVTDVLPIIETSSTSPPSNHSLAVNQPYGGAVFRTHQASSSNSTHIEGVTTPEYNFAEIGNGQQLEEIVYPGDAHSDDTLRHGTPTSETTIRYRASAPPDAAWPYAEPAESSTSSKQFASGSAPQLSREQPTESDDARGRSVKRNLRNTLQAAETYASTFLFGRSSNGSGDASGSSPSRQSGNGTGNIWRGR